MAKRGRPVREEYTAAQKENILTAAGRVFTERGYQRATTKAIAEAAGVSEGAIYYHFENKRDLLFGVLERLLGGAGPEAEKTPTAAAADAATSAEADFRTHYASAVQARIRHAQPWVATFFALISDILTDEELAQHLYQTSFAPLLKRSENSLERAIERGELRNLDVPLVARLLLGQGLGIDLLYLMGDETIRAALNGSGDKLAETIGTVILDGISRK